MNSYNFARSCDIVYSEVISHENFKNLAIEDYKVIFEDEVKIFYKLNSISVKENDVVFCNTYMLESLFKLLKKVNLQNIKLVTHQTDLSITKDIFDSKPDCVSEWYSINIAYANKDLISIPIGLSNEYSPKNLFQNNYKNFNFISLEEKKIKGYANFRINTNNKVRESVQKKLINFDWVEFDEPNLKMDEYLNQLIEHKYILAPFGNGIDTHRIWESLYAGSIPVVQEHVNFSAYRDLPKVVVKNFNDLNITFLENYTKSIDQNSFNSEKLRISYWINLINLNSVKEKEEVFHLRESEKDQSFFIKKHLRREKNNSRLKKVLYNFRRIRNRLNKLFSLLN